MELSTRGLREAHPTLLTLLLLLRLGAQRRNVCDAGRGAAAHRPGGQVGGALPGLPHPLRPRETAPHARGRCASRTRPSQAHAHGLTDALPAALPRGPPRSPRLRLGIDPGPHPHPGPPGPRRRARTAPAPSLPGAEPSRPPASSPSPFGRTRPTEVEGRGAGGRAFASAPGHPGGKRWRRSPGSAAPPLILTAERGLGPPRGSARAAGRAEGPRRRGRGSGAASFLLSHRGSRSQAGRPRTLAHPLPASQGRCGSPSRPAPTPTRVPTPSAH